MILTGTDQPLLKIDKATLRKDGQIILDDVNVTIPVGQHTALLGPNGSGKSSLIKLITHQHYALARKDGLPTVSILGRHTWNIGDLRRMMGIVSADMHQYFVVEGDLAGEEVVVSGHFASKGVARHHRVTESMRQRARECLAQVGAENLCDKAMQQMSTGEARRVLIARALVADPAALVLDEPTTGLDLMASSLFLTMLGKIAQSGKTIILVTHHVSEILPQIGRVILLKDGKVFRDGSKQDVMTTKNLSALFDANIVVERSGEWYSAHMVSD